MRKIGKILLSALFFLSVSAALTSCKPKAQSVEFIFNANGGTEIARTEVKAGEEFTLPVPEREGYSFEGWYTDEAFGGSPVVTVTAEGESVTYYAKWERLYTLTLDADGGVLSETVLSVKADTVLSELLKDRVPVKEGFLFGAWYNGQNELGETEKMPAAGLTLTAKYKVGYTAEIYTQSLDSDEYKKETVTDYAFVGTELTLSSVPEGFYELVCEDTVRTLVLSADASENVFRRYFNREEFTVMFHSNYPDGSANEVTSFKLRYGETAETPAGIFSKNGYCLTGWASIAGGEAEYRAGMDFYNADSVAADTVSAGGNMMLYAVWLKGYVNLFGGGDCIFLPKEEPTAAYLSRGGVYFKGEYSASRKEFIFVDDRDDILLEGKINDDGTYSYYDVRRSESFNTLYKVGVGLVESTNIYFDEYNGIRYVEGRSVSYGSYKIDESGHYIATFESGDLAGRTLVLLLGTVTLDDVETSVFRVRSDEEYGLGTLRRGVVYNGVLTYYLEAYSLTLNGFGTAAYNGASGVTYYYTLENDELTLSDSEGALVGTARIFEIDGQKCYMFYDAEFDRTFQSDSGAVLTLDGMYSASYTNGGESVSGYYSTRSSVFGGTIVTIETKDGVYKFLIRATAEESDGVIGDDGQTPADGEKVYTLEVKSAGYAEYYYKDEKNVYYAPMLVTDDPEAGKAILYGYTSSREFVKISEGRYETNEETGRMIYTAERIFDVEALTEPIDIASVQSFEFSLGSAAVSSSSYDVSYWFSFTDKNGGTTSYETVYRAGDGGRLILAAGIASYLSDGAEVSGSYTLEDNVLTLSAASGEKLYFELDEEAGSFLKLEEAPYLAEVYERDGSVNAEKTFRSDGKGGAVYTLGTNAGYEGRVESTGRKTSSGAAIYRFVSDEITFEFIRLYSSDSTLIAIYDEQYVGRYAADGDSALNLDGFGYMAIYTAADGEIYRGRYSIIAENVARVSVDGVYRYFDLADGTFTLRGIEYGEYVRSDNHSPSDVFFALDGYGGLSVFTIGEDGVRRYTAQGTYETEEGGIALNYVQGNETVNGSFAFVSDIYTYGGERYGVIAVLHEEVVKTYVNESDWSVLVLDNAGNAVKYDENGVRRAGTYTLITDELLYFTTDDGEDACIYIYNTAAGSATPVRFTARGYYTKELDSLLFSQCGFAIFDNGERCYYNIVNNDVIIYRQDALDPDASVYGFVAENFGRFDNVKEYNGKTYYSNNGFAVQFGREEANKDKYPVALTSGSTSRYALESLSFSPNGSETFTVSGIVVINGRNYTAYVTRAKDGNGDIYMYMTVGTYRVDIEISYNGTDSYGQSLSTYKIVGLRGVVSAPAYAYLDNYYKYYVTMGAAYASGYQNNIGVVSVNYVYDEAGELSSSYISGEFGEASGIYDSEGNILSFVEAAFEYDPIEKVYTAVTAGDDGYTYRLYFTLRNHPAYRNTFGYYVYAFTREEILTTEDGYRIVAERIVSSDSASRKPGLPVGLALEKNGEAIGYSGALISTDRFCYISRTNDENGRPVSSVYYYLTFTENASVEIGDGRSVLATYRSAAVERVEIKLLATEDGGTFIEVNAENSVVLISVGESVALAKESVYDEASATYTITTTDGKKYVVKLTEDKGAISGVTESA